MRLLLPLVLLLLTSLAAQPALAAPAGPSAYRLPPPRKPAAAAPVRPAGAPGAQSRPARLAGTLLPQPSFSAAPGLAALGLEPMRLGAADAAPACRQACASARYMCGVEDETCGDRWRQCIQGCSGAGSR